MLLLAATRVLLSEDFEGVTPPSFPVGWYVVDGNSDSFTWNTYDNTATADSLTCGNNDLHSYFTSNYACYDDDDAGSSAPAGDDALATPTINLKQYGTPTAVRLIYRYAFEDINGASDTFYVMLKLFEGSTRTNAYVAYYYDVPDVTGGPDTAGVDTLDITSVTAGKDSMIVFFIYRDKGNWGWGAGVDDIVVEVDVVTTAVEENPVEVVGRTVVAEEGVIYDASGRLVGKFRGRYTLPKGVYFVEVRGRMHRVVITR